MVVAGSEVIEWNNFREIEETVGCKMGKDDGAKVEDVEEGEISDTASVEEISEEDFNNQENVAKVASKESNQESRVWRMRDVYKSYPIGRGYATGLYNLAWAQAVQNKPLNDIFVMEVDPEEKSKRSSSSPSVNSKEDDKSLKEVDKVVIDDSGDEMDDNIVNVDKEEGELEEGEIDLDAEPVEPVNVVDMGIPCYDSRSVDNLEAELKLKDLEKKVNLVCNELENVTMNNAEKSLEEVCFRLHSTFEKLLELLSEKHVPRKDALIQLSLGALQVVRAVFCSTNSRPKDEDKCQLLRLLSLVKKQNPPVFSSEQMKELEVLMRAVDSSDILPSSRGSDEVKENQVISGLNAKDTDTLLADSRQYLTSTKLPPDTTAGGSIVYNNRNMSSEVSSFKTRGTLLPLLDLHKDHDAESLPSPTRETPSHFTAHKTLVVGDGTVKHWSAPARVALDVADSRSQFYETDALKAVSSYQQKFGRSSLFTKDRLPSPTPSEECDDRGEDVNGEVSSSFIVGNIKTTNLPILGQPNMYSVSSLTFGVSPKMDSFNVQGPSTGKNAASLSCMPNPTVKPSAKSRDPRLRFLHSDGGALDLNGHPSLIMHNNSKPELVETICSRKQKIDEEPKLDGPALKRQKNGLDSHSMVKDTNTISGCGGWLEDYNLVGSQLMNKNQLTENAEKDFRKMVNSVDSPIINGGNVNAASYGNEQALLPSTSGSSSFPDLLKDIAVNPTILINILKMGQQQRLAAESQQKSAETEKSAISLSSNSILGAAPLASVILQKPAGKPQVPPQISPMDESGKIRMKPRDPRRILHGNTLQKSVSLGKEQFSTSSTQSSKDNVNGQNQEGSQGEKKPAPLPDITRQFTKNLKSLADIMSVSQASSISQNLSSRSVSIVLDKVDVKSELSNSEDSPAGNNSVSEVGVTGTSQAQSTWGDVEHLFEGFDDQQKAAIQRERARRIEEQKKMFAARKLCLVLDLDHTLLNSAKFVEVEPAHDEILRKKEEQDREKTHRHLFRFPHMGMWTKLRPGIWNFLEKASKLYELHLYTMGNKLYATEMAKVLDPKGVLFAGRVISRGDEGDPLDGDERVPKSKDLEGVLGMESAVVIIDDSVRVWPHNKLNLIVVERYTYFPCSRRQFGLPGPSLLEIDHDERPEDGTLASSLAVIEKIHQSFFSHRALDEADVRNILASEQQKILTGCRIVFSRVFPVGEANPHLHPLWQTAEQFGAVCTNQIDEQVTHVVANSLGTDKVNWALSSGKFVVHPGWVEASALLYRRANEQDFAIKA